MDDDFVPLQINNYLKQISEITVESETKHYLITRGEKEKKEIEEEIEQLKKTKCELEQIKDKSITELGKLKIKIYNLSEENKCVDELELEHRNCKKNEDTELWNLSQSVYSELISYCDNVQEFVENYQFPNIINEFLYPFSTKKVASSKDEGVTEKKILQIDELKAVEVKLKEQLDDLKNKHSFFMGELGKKAQLKHEPLEGKEFLELQGAITSCKEISKKLLAETSELECKKNQKYFTKKIVDCPVETSSNSKYGDNVKLSESQFYRDARNFNSVLACDKTTNLNDPSNKLKSSKKVTFVPKIGKRFRSTNFK